MVSVTGSVTWISHSSSVIAMDPDPRRQRDERHANRYRPERTTEAGRQLARRWKADATPLPGTAVKGRVSNSPTGAVIGPNASKQERMRWNIASGVSSLRTDFPPSWTIFGLKKKEAPAFRTWETVYCQKYSQPRHHQWRNKTGYRMEDSFPKEYLQAIADLENSKSV